MNGRPPYQNYLWSPSRNEWSGNTSAQNLECLFCAMEKNGEEVETLVVFEDEFLRVCLNLYPYNPGHLMVIPRAHIGRLAELSSSQRNRLFAMVQATETLIETVMDPAGLNVGLNMGAPAGESVPHLHVHLVPVYEHDRGFMEVALQTKVMREPLGETLETFREHRTLISDYWSPE